MTRVKNMPVCQNFRKKYFQKFLNDMLTYVKVSCTGEVTCANQIRSNYEATAVAI